MEKLCSLHTFQGSARSFDEVAVVKGVRERMVEVVVEEIVEEVQKCVCQVHEWKKSIYRTVNRGVGYKSAGSRKNICDGNNLKGLKGAGRSSGVNPTRYRYLAAVTTIGATRCFNILLTRFSLNEQVLQKESFCGSPSSQTLVRRSPRITCPIPNHPCRRPLLRLFPPLLLATVSARPCHCE